MVAWCHDSNDTIPPSQLLQVRHRHIKVFCLPHCVSNLHSIVVMNSISAFTQLWCLCVRPHSFTSCMKAFHIEQPFSRSPVLLPHAEFLKFQSLPRDPGFPLHERNWPQVLEEALHVSASLRSLLLHQRNIQGRLDPSLYLYLEIRLYFPEWTQAL